MDSFSSYFELTAALNYAFVISTHFINSIAARVCIQYQELKRLINRLIKSKEDVIKNSEGISALSIKRERDAFVKLNAELVLLKKECDETVEKISDEIKEFDEPRNFNHLCLFGGLYATIILLMIGVTPLLKNGFQIKFLGFSTALLLPFLIWLYNTERFNQKLQSGYFHVLLGIFVGFTVAGILTYFTFQKDLVPTVAPRETIWFVIGFSLIMPISHFGFYFYKIIADTKKAAIAHIETVKKLLIKAENLNVRFTERLETISDLTVDGEDQDSAQVYKTTKPESLRASS